MELHSISQIITNSSTQTFTRVIGIDELYEHLQLLLMLLHDPRKARDVFHVQIVLKDKEGFFDWVETEMGEEGKIVWTDYSYEENERNHAIVDEAIEAGDYTEEQYLDEDSYFGETVYLISTDEGNWFEVPPVYSDEVIYV